MKKDIFSLSLVIISITLINCTGDNDQKHSNSPKNISNSIKIDVTRVSNVSMNDLYSWVELIPLETTDKSIIQEVNKLVYFENSFFILDENQNAVFIFDSCGKFLNKIQNIGNGPGEYSLLYDFDINYFTKNIELLNPRGELLIYNRNGSFVRSLKIPLRAPQKFIVLTEDIVLFYSLYDQNKLAYFSKDRDSIIKRDFEFPDVILNTPLISSKSSPFNRCDSITTFFQGFSNEIFNIVNTELSFRFKWDFGKYNFSFSELVPNKPNNYYPNFLRSSKFVHSFNYYIENRRYVYTRFMYNKFWFTIILDKTKSEYRLVRKFKEQTVPPAFPSFFDKGILTTIDPSQIQILVNESILDQKSKKIYNNLKLEDNPVIIKYHFKEQ
jgi:hypothetical protein